MPTDDERRVLDTLMSRQPPRERTVEAIASGLGITDAAARRALEGLRDRTPPLAEADIDAGLDIEFWRTTPHVADV